MSDGSQFTGWDVGTMSREQVAQAAYEAGWRGEDLTKIVAIAYRESGGHFAVFVDRPSTGDWSYGLVGLNVGRPDASGQGDIWKSFYSKLDFLKSPDDLRDPVKNMRAAKALFDQGGWRPWGPYKGVSETTGTDVDAAHAAVESAASHGLLGKDYDAGLKPLPAAAAPDAHPALQTFLKAALAHEGDKYVAGARPAATDLDPHTFDCSSFTQWSARQAGVKLDNTAEAQYLQLKATGSTISVEQAMHTPGALLFHLPREPVPGEAFGPNAHVAISLGDGRTIEAIGSKYGVQTVDVEKFHTGGSAFFTRAAVVPGLSDGSATPLPPLPGAVGAPGTPGAPATDAAAHQAPAHEELPPLAGAWRQSGDVALVAHATPDHLVELVPLPPVGTLGRSHDAGLAPLLADPQHQPELTATPDPLHPATADPLHPAAAPDALHAAVADAAHPDTFAITAADWTHGHELPGEIHHYDWTSGHPLPGETHPDPHDPHQDPVHDVHQDDGHHHTDVHHI